MGRKKIQNYLHKITIRYNDLVEVIDLNSRGELIITREELHNRLQKFRTLIRNKRKENANAPLTNENVQEDSIVFNNFEPTYENLQNLENENIQYNEFFNMDGLGINDDAQYSDDYFVDLYN